MYAMSLVSPGWVFTTVADINPTTGPFTTTTVIQLPSWSQVTVSCNLGKATSSLNSYLYDAYVTQSP